MTDDQFRRLIEKAKQLHFKRFDLAWNWLTWEPAAGMSDGGFSYMDRHQLPLQRLVHHTTGQHMVTTMISVVLN